MPEFLSYALCHTHLFHTPPLQCCGARLLLRACSRGYLATGTISASQPVLVADVSDVPVAYHPQPLKSLSLLSLLEANLSLRRLKSTLTTFAERPGCNQLEAPISGSLSDHHLPWSHRVTQVLLQNRPTPDNLVSWSFPSAFSCISILILVPVVEEVLPSFSAVRAIPANQVQSSWVRIRFPFSLHLAAPPGLHYTHSNSNPSCSLLLYCITPSSIQARCSLFQKWKRPLTLGHSKSGSSGTPYLLPSLPSAAAACARLAAAIIACVCVYITSRSQPSA